MEEISLYIGTRSSQISIRYELIVCLFGQLQCPRIFFIAINIMTYATDNSEDQSIRKCNQVMVVVIYKFHCATDTVIFECLVFTNTLVSYNGCYASLI